MRRPPLGRRLEDHDRLIRPRNHGLRDGDQMALLVEHAQPGRLPVSRIELRRRPLRNHHMPRLNLRNGHIEFRAMPHAA